MSYFELQILDFWQKLFSVDSSRSKNQIEIMIGTIDRILFDNSIMAVWMRRFARMGFIIHNIYGKRQLNRNSVENHSNWIEISSLRIQTKPNEAKIQSNMHIDTCEVIFEASSFFWITITLQISMIGCEWFRIKSCKSFYCILFYHIWSKCWTIRYKII